MMKNFSDKTIKFSIILPVYNDEKHLEKAIISVIEQNYSNWELIIVNDGSTDNTESICGKYEQLYYQIHCFSKANGGVSAARNFALERVTGDYVIFLDSDDYLEHYCLRTIAENDKLYDSEILIFNYFTDFQINKVVARDITVEKITDSDRANVIEFIFRMSQYHGNIWYGNLKTVWGKVFKVQFLKDHNILFDVHLKIGEDMIFILDCLLNAKDIKTMNEPLYHYCINDMSAMHNTSWNGDYQGRLYLKLAENKAKKYVNKEICADLWLETVEQDWYRIHMSKISLWQQMKIFKELVKTDNYIRFSKSDYKCSSTKAKVYRICNRLKRYEMLWLLSYLRILKQRHKIV